MMSVRQIKDWINTVDDHKGVAIDDGGLALVVVDDDGEADPDEGYLEVGGLPSSDCLEEDPITSEMPDLEPEDMVDDECFHP